MIRIVERLIFPLFFVTVVLGLAYWYWTTTPTYALSQIVGAVKNKDTETFEKYVDIESIAERAIDDVLHGKARESGMFGSMDNMIGVGIIGLFKPEIAEIAKTQVLKFIEAGSLASSAGELGKTVPAAAIVSASSTSSSASSSTSTSSTSTTTTSTGSASTTSTEKSADADPTAGISENSMVGKYTRKMKIGPQLKAYGLSKQGFKGIDYLKIEGPTAYIGFKFHSEKFNRDIIIEIKMEDAGGYWRVTELSNLNDLINTYIETKDKLDSASSLLQTKLLLLA